MPDTLVYDGIKKQWLEMKSPLLETSRIELQRILKDTYWEPRDFQSEVYYQTFEYHIYRRPKR